MKKLCLMILEELLEYLNDDEFCEVILELICLCKKIFDKSECERVVKKKKFVEV